MHALPLMERGLGRGLEGFAGTVCISQGSKLETNQTMESLSGISLVEVTSCES